MNPTVRDNKLLKDLTNEVDNSQISSIKQTVIQLIRLINDPNSNANDLKHVIELDPPLSAKLLKLSHSAYYGYAKEICDIKEAIVCIGFDAIKELALNQKVFELFTKSESMYGYSRIALWKHCIAVALCSKLIYRREFRERGDTVYIAGLLHDIGIIVLDQFLSDDFRKILRLSRNRKRTMLRIEEEILGFSHADIGREIAIKWGFSDELINAIAYHHTPEKADDKYIRSTATIFAADYACQRSKVGFDEYFFSRNTLFRKYRIKLDIKELALKFIMEDVEEEIAGMEEMGIL